MRTQSRMDGIQMLELGDQVIFDRSIRDKTAKQHFTKRGVLHTSFDLNGRNGAQVVNLGEPDATQARQNHYDVITNMGTTEHIEPKPAQYECFANIHAWAKIGGIIIHAVPSAEDLTTTKKWVNHCNYYYGQDFFRWLAATNGYELMDLRIVDGLAFSCLRKVTAQPFMTARSEFLSWISEDNRAGSILYPGVNDSGRKQPLAAAYRKIAQSTALWRGRIGLTGPALKSLLKKKP